MAKQIKVREDNYFAVQGWMVTELKLKGKSSKAWCPYSSMEKVLENWRLL